MNNNAPHCEHRDETGDHCGQDTLHKLQDKWLCRDHIDTYMATPHGIAVERDHSEYDQMDQMEAGFQLYSSLATAYESTINLENDPDRKEQLIRLLVWLHEDNK